MCSGSIQLEPEEVSTQRGQGHLDPKGTGQTRWAVRWKPALNAFAITFADRMPAAEDR